MAPPSPFFSLSLAGGGSGWGSRQGERSANGPCAAPVPAGPEPLQSKNRSVRISMLSRGREPGPLRGSSNVPCAVQRAVPSVFES